MTRSRKGGGARWFYSKYRMRFFIDGESWEFGPWYYGMENLDDVAEAWADSPDATDAEVERFNRVNEQFEPYKTFTRRQGK